MRKLITAFMMIAALVSLSSCALIPQASPSPTPSPSASASAGPSVSPSPSPLPSSPSPEDSAAVKFLATEPAAPALAAYMKENTQSISKADADLLLERLILLQLDISNVMNQRIWDNAYMSALNDTLGGILDKDKIGNIKDNAVRADFQEAADSLMTMVRYEETPVFETDWAALEAMKDTFSDGTAQLITYQSRFQGRYYSGDPYKFELMAKDIAAVEKLIAGTENGFIRWKLKSLFTRQVGRILHGAEGEWLFAFSDGDAQVTQHIKDFAETFADTEFGSLCAGMLKIQDGGVEGLSALIGESLAFPPGDSRGLTKTVLDENGTHIEIPQVTGLKDNAAAEKINAFVSEYAEMLVKNENDNQSVGYYMSFANDRYINFVFTYSYRNESDMDHYAESYLLFDLETGEPVSLDSLAGKKYDDFKDALLKAMGSNAPADLALPVNFFIDGSELTVTVLSKTSDWPDYYPVTFNGLRSFMDISKLY